MRVIFVCLIVFMTSFALSYIIAAMFTSWIVPVYAIKVCIAIALVCAIVSGALEYGNKNLWK